MKLISVLSEWLLTSAFLILAVLALRALLGKRISGGLRYALWAVVLVRLLVPVQLFPSPTGTSILRETGLEQLTADPPEWEAPYPAVSASPALSEELPGGTVLVYNADPAPATVKVEPLTALQVLGWLWLAGSAAMAAAFILSNTSFALRLRRVRTRLEEAGYPLPVYTAPGLPSPCLFGILRPAVYVTPETAADPDMLRHVLAHEYTHFRHGDHIWNGLRSAALCLHWWNPLVWLSVELSRRDCELACDEGTLKRLGAEERFAYGRTLLALITVKPRPGDLLRCATTMTGGQKSVFDRVTRIARAPKRWLWAAVAAVAATALACVCAFGQADKPDTSPAAGVTADLTFSLETDSDGKPYVRMDGTVDGVELTRGAFWNPDWRHGDYYDPELTLVYPPFTDGIEGHIEANWEGGPGSDVTIITRPTAMFSRNSEVGYWVFSVNLDSGTVWRQRMPYGSTPEGGTRFYPASISDEEAVKAARIAAKLLTAGKDYYRNHTAALETESTPDITSIPNLESFHSPAAQVSGYPSTLDFEFYATEPGMILRFSNLTRAVTPSDEVSFHVERYTILDLDHDGTTELILKIERSRRLSDPAPDSGRDLRVPHGPPRAAKPQNRRDLPRLFRRGRLGISCGFRLYPLRNGDFRFHLVRE